MYSVLYTNDQIANKALECANWIDYISLSNPNTLICPILQSSFYFATNVFANLKTNLTVDFCGVSRYEDDGTIDELYMYKGPSVDLYDGKTVIVLDTLISTGSTMDFVSKFLKQMGAKKVHTASLLVRQFSKIKPDWKGYVISDESVFGYGLDLNSQYRTLNYIAHE